MKKLLLVILGGCVFPAFAQQNASKNQYTQEPTHRVKGTIQVQETPKLIQANNFSHLAKTTAVPFVQEDFGSGTPTSLPTGWSAASVVGPGTWKWINVASTGAFTIGAINSTTAANGWMIYDSDSIGAINNATTLEGFMQSPSYNCFGHPTVQLSFEEHFRRFSDSCFILVSNNGGASFTEFPVMVNNNLSSTSSLPTNPYTVRMNISSVAANQADVIIRFRYKFSGPAGGGYSWLVDDLALSELDPVEFAATDGGIIMIDGTGGFTTFGAITKNFVDSIIPVVVAENNGDLSPNAIYKAEILRGTTSVYNQMITLNSLASGTIDSLLEFPMYYTNIVGNYTAAFNVNATGDAVTTNNNDSVSFQITDKVYHRMGNSSQSSYYIHRPNTNASGEGSNSIGIFITVPAGKSDTLTSVDASFASTTTPGSRVVVRIYKLVTVGTTGQYNFTASTEEKALTAADISTDSTSVYTKFNIDLLSSPFIMDGGDYAVVVVGNNIPAANTVLLRSATSTSPQILDLLHGVLDTSQNDGITGFGGPNNLPFRIDASPRLRLNYDNISGINDVNNIEIAGNIYPNPANENINIAFSLKHSANVNLSIVNTLGQVVKSRSLGKVNAQQTSETTFSTSDLANGVYLYNIDANGSRVSKRFVVTH